MDNESRKALFVALKEAGLKMDNQFNLYAKSVGLSFPAILILQLLHDSTEVYTQRDICERLGLPKQFVYSIIKPFWAQGFVELKEAKDRRTKEIILTTKGKEYALSILQPMEDAESALLESFSDDELITLVRTMEKYVKSFDSLLKKII